MLLAGSGEPSRVLDLPCGHGRVMRALRAAFRNAEITGCDLDRDAVDYCTRTFGATGIVSGEDLGAIRWPGAYDLVWCGSLLTHLPVEGWKEFLALFDRVLAPGGVLVFTTHGRRTAGWLRRRRTDAGLTLEQMYGLTTPLADELLSNFDRSGFGFVDYPRQEGYGISLSALPFVIGLAQRATGLGLVACLEHGWDEHQDVVACLKPWATGARP
jgi:cyclopropane fatty-acyl-phospholipid synthase-like methyltransferase